MANIDANKYYNFINKLIEVTKAGTSDWQMIERYPRCFSLADYIDFHYNQYEQVVLSDSVFMTHKIGHKYTYSYIYLLHICTNNQIKDYNKIYLKDNIYDINSIEPSVNSFSFNICIQSNEDISPELVFPNGYDDTSEYNLYILHQLILRKFNDAEHFIDDFLRG